MAVVNSKSTAITNADAHTPQNNSLIEKGDVFVSSGRAVVAAGDDDGSKYRICRLPAKVKILAFRVKHAAITAGTDYDVGTYRTADDGGLVVDADSLVDGADFSTARTVPTEILGLNLTIDNEKKLWELQSGVTSEPQYDYDIVVTANTVGTAAVTVNVDVLWTW